MEQLQELLPAPRNFEDVNLRLRTLFKKAFEIRQMQLMMMKEIEDKYTLEKIEPPRQLSS